MSLNTLIHRDIKKVSPTATIVDAAKLMRRCKIGSAFIEEDGKFVGIVTEADMVRKALTKELPYDTPARLLMSAPLIEIDINRSVMDANHLMHFNGIRHLGVSESGRVVGMISVRDLVHHFSVDKQSPLNLMGDVLKPLTVITHREIHTVEAGASTQEAAQKMSEKKAGSLIVTDEGAYIGILTETDLVRKVVGYGLAPSRIPVGVIMNTPIVDIEISRSIQEANELMATKGIRHLAVTEMGRIVGVLSIRDLIGMISIRDLPRFFSTKK